MDDKIYVDLYELIQNLFIDLIEYVNKSEDENKYIFSHHKFPMLRGYDKNGLPIGMSLVGNAFDEKTIIAMCDRFEKDFIRKEAVI